VKLGPGKTLNELLQMTLDEHVFEGILHSLAQAAQAQAVLLDKQEAPQRKLECKQQQDDNNHAAQSRSGGQHTNIWL
jgi:hypothetical protein